MSDEGNTSRSVDCVVSSVASNPARVLGKVYVPEL